jgi:subtilisin-like proprotein convertase family protein
LATIPGATPTGAPVNLTSLTDTTTGGNANNPTVVVDPHDSQKLLAVWGVDLSTLSPVPHTTAVIEGAYSDNGGASWIPLDVSFPILDAATITANPPTSYTQVTHPSAGFDSQGNVYLLTMQTSGTADGALTLSKFDFSGSTPQEVFNSVPIQRWLPGADAVFSATMAVDAGLRNPPAGVAADPHANNVYIAWASGDVHEANANVETTFNPNRIKLAVSSDGGNSFSGETIANAAPGSFDNGNAGPQNDSHPQLVINQNNGGQVTVAWADFNSNSGTLAPPQRVPHDVIVSNRVQPGDSYGFTNGGGPIAPGIAGSNGAPDTPVTTPFNVSVNVPNPAAITGLVVTVNLIHPTVGDLSLVLQAPNNGPKITLMLNAVNSANAMTGNGVTGADLGVFGHSTTNPGIDIGTVFDDNATRNIFDPTTTGMNGVGAPAIGHFRPETGSLTAFLAAVGAGINGTWTLQITDFRNETTPGALRNVTLQFTTGMSQGAPSIISAGLAVLGALGDTFGTYTAPSSPTGIGSGLVMAIDNTLGNSPYQGRIYAAFVGYLNIENPVGITNPTTNTDIFLSYSDNGGLSWNGLVEVNDDASIVDGFTQSNENTLPGDQATGRTQFLPEVAVDQATGTLVVSWRDARDDAANSRVATYITTSIDGGQTFSPQTYANPQVIAVDAITGKTNVLGPKADNQGGSNAQRDSGFGYGQMGLAVSGGQLFPIWAGNFYAPFNVNVGPPTFPNNLNSFLKNGAVTAFPLNIWYRPMAIAAGPRILTSSMGPISLAEAASGSVAISVTFDRPVSPSSVSPADVQVFYHDTKNGDSSIQLLVTSFAPTGGGNSPTTQYTITFNPSKKPDNTSSGITNYTGTYSYLIAPDNGAATPTAISAPIWSFVNGSLRRFDPADQNADGTPDQNAVTTAFTGLTPGDVYAAPAPQPTAAVTFQGAFGINNNYGILQAPFNQNTLPLIVPGPQVLTTSVPGGNGDNLIVNGTTSTLNVTFDRPMQVSTFTSGQVLQIMGPTGPIIGPQYFPAASTGQTIPAATSTAPGVLNAPLSIPNLNGSFKIAKLTVSFTAAFPTDSALSGILIAPDKTQIHLFSGVGGAGSDFINTVFDDAAQTSITAGTAPFTGTFKPTDMLSLLNGKKIDANGGTWTLQLTNTMTGTTGVLDSWSLSITPVISVTPVSPASGLASTFTIGFPQQQLSGTYTIQLGTGILDQFNQAPDTNQNAGLDVLRGQSQNVPTTTVKYNAADLPKPIAPGSVSSSIVVPDNFLVQGDMTSALVSGLRVQINLTYPNDPDLTATLYHYDLSGTNLLDSIPLFTNVGHGTNTANFTNTVFDDMGGTPIQNGSAPFFATFEPQMPLSAFAGMSAEGIWKLVIQNAPSGTSGTFNSWSLTFQKPVPTTGLGEPGTDNIGASFRLFTLGQTDALSSQAWTAVGPAAIGTSTGGDEASSSGGAGRVTGLAIDPSDSSGNTVFAAGASGGVWKTTNFLTSNGGPTWVPLTDFGPTNAINIGSIAVFPRNHDPNQSLVIAATGEGDTGSPGVGFLISQDGGATWNLYDSLVNVDSSGNLLPIQSAARDRTFVGLTSFKVTVDPQLTPTGQVIMYAALSGGGSRGGIYRSEDTGKTWQQMLSGQATDVVLDPSSGIVLDPTSDVAVHGNLQVVYAGISGVGVFMSPNQGQVWNQMNGGVGNPLIVDDYIAGPPNVATTNGLTPNGNQGRIVLAVPNATGNAAQDPIYAGWLYATVSTQGGTLYGIFQTKDFGQNWTQVRVPSLPPVFADIAQAIPSNDVRLGDYSVIGNTRFPQGNYNITMAVDPTNPNVIYVGGTADGNQTGLIRIDATNIWDAHSLVAHSSNFTDGSLDLSSMGPATTDTNLFEPFFLPGGRGGVFFDYTSYQNFIRNPYAPFVAGSRLDVFNYSRFTNNGGGVTWTAFDVGGTDYHRVVTMVDPTTGLPRLIFGNDQGIWSVLDNNGTFETQVGSSDQLAGINRNGNIQITQFYYGAAQPSSAAAQIAGALFYGSAQDNGGPVSDPNVISNGNISWGGPGGDAGGVGTDQQGLGSAYQYFWPCCGGDAVNFFQYIPAGSSGSGAYIGRTFGLLQASGSLPSPDPTNWPFGGGANFAVNPVNSSDVVISSAVGRIFATSNQGVTWFDIGDPGIFGNPGSFSVALAYGAPDPAAPAGLGNLGNFIYVGTQTGQIYVTQNGGGGGSGAPNSWLNISLGLSGGAVRSIITDPIRGTHDAYAVTSGGVFYLKDSVLLGNNPTNTAYQWVNITGNIHNLAYSIFGQAYDPTTDPNSTKYQQAVILSSIVADWRYTIPNDPSNPSAGFHPVLYVGAGNSASDRGSGVFQSLDNGKTWTLFPTTTFGAVADGGYLPHVAVTDLDVSLGNINVQTGMPNLAGPYDPTKPSAPDPDLLLATTYGRGQFAINLAPILFPSSVTLGPTGVSGADPNGNPIVTGPVTFNGLSEITGFGNATRITIVDVTNPASPKIIGGFDPSKLAATNVAANWTNALGNFALTVDPANVYTSNGLKTVMIYATDDAGAVSNKVTVSFTLNDNSLPQPPPTSPPSFTQNLAMAPGDIKSTISGTPVVYVTNNPTPTFVGTTNIGVTLTVYEKDSSGNLVVPTFDITSDPTTGAFSFQFKNPNNVTFGNFTVQVFAQWTNFGGFQPTPSNVVSFQINNQVPAPVTNFRLDPTDDTGIVGDNVTTVRKPHFIGTTGPGNTVQLFQAFLFTGTLTSGSATVTGLSSTTGLAVGEQVTGTGIPSGTKIASINGATGMLTLSQNATAGGSQSLTATGLVAQAPPPGQTVTADANGNFSIQLPYALTNGQISLDVEVTNSAGNISTPSNAVSVAITSAASDYNGDSFADPALFRRVTTGNVGQWLVQTATFYTSASSPPPPWFGTNGTPFAFGSSTGVPFQADLDGDGITDLAYYDRSTATWYMAESKTYASQGAFSFSLGTPNSSLPVIGHFDANAPAEAAVFTVNSSGQGIWTIASATAGIRNITFGQANDIPVPGAYDGFAYDELAVYRPSTGQFLVLNPVSGQTETLDLGVGNSPDLSSLVPIPGQYDNLAYYNASPLKGKNTPIFGHTEAAVFDPKTGVFTILGPPDAGHPNGVVYTVSGFQPNDIPASADYAGSGSDQPVVYRPSAGKFLTANGTVIATFGQSSDIPVTSPLSYRLPPNPPSNPPGGGGTGGGSTGGGGTGGGGTLNTGGGGGTGGGSTGGTGTVAPPSGGSSNSPPTQPVQNPVTTPPGTSSHLLKNKKKKVVVNHKAKAPHHKPKPAPHVAKKTTAHPKPKVTHKPAHAAKKAVVVVHPKPATHVVDLALEGVHVNLRRSTGKHHA